MTILRARISADGALLSADPAILALQVDAGGSAGGPLLVPQLAALARLAARLAIPLSRPVVAAANHADIDMWVRARPADGGVELAIVDWQERAPRAERDAPGRNADLVLAGEGWWWQVDTHMRFVAAEGAADETAARDLPTAGTKLTAYFRLIADSEGDMPILHAFAERRPFSAQKAAPVADASIAYRLSGVPTFDAAGRLTGYRGRAAVERESATLATEPLFPHTPGLFGLRLDRALRQPLGRIIANADTISSRLEGPLRDDYATYAADIASAGRHLMELVDDLADLQAIDRPDFAVAAEEIDLADIARRAAGLLAVKASDKHITVDAPLPGVSALASGEFRRALQIMVNLIGNAIRYSPDHSVVRVEAHLRDGHAGVTVIDQGRGIAIADQERIFEKFERLGRDEAGGSGLGLYISRRLARAMGGDIVVETRVGEGARFTLTLPAKPA